MRSSRSTVYKLSYQVQFNLYVLQPSRTIERLEVGAVPTSRSAGSGSTTTSWRLIERAHVGDRSALGRLVGRCLPALRRWAHRRLPDWARTAADTTDLIQDVVLQTLRRGRRIDLRSREALAAYLRQAVRNRIRDEHRRFARHGTHETPSDLLVDRAPSPFDRTLARERNDRYRAALARLTPRERELIVGHVELGFTHEQLGCMTGRSRDAARMALDRAVRRLATLMKDA
jgi:RNA polymerase sigma-70 factor, ECF subfamily